MTDKNSKLKCPDCVVDRLKLPCPRMADECAMIGDAHLLAAPVAAPEAPTSEQQTVAPTNCRDIDSLQERLKMAGICGESTTLDHDQAWRVAFAIDVTKLSTAATTASASDVRMLVANIPLPEGSKQFQHGFVSAKEAMLAALPARAPAPSRDAAREAMKAAWQVLIDAGIIPGTEGMSLADGIRAALTQQSAAQAPILEKLAQAEESVSQYQQNVLELAEELRSVRAAQAAHAGADGLVAVSSRSNLAGFYVVLDYETKEQSECAEKIFRAAMSAATEREPKNG